MGEFRNIIPPDTNSNNKQTLTRSLPESDAIIMSRPVAFFMSINVSSRVDSKLDLGGFSELGAGLNSLRMGGRMAALVPDMFLFSEETESLRQYLVKLLLKAIVALHPEIKPFSKEA